MKDSVLADVDVEAAIERLATPCPWAMQKQGCDVDRVAQQQIGRRSVVEKDLSLAVGMVVDPRA